MCACGSVIVRMCVYIRVRQRKIHGLAIHAFEDKLFLMFTNNECVFVWYMGFEARKNVLRVEIKVDKKVKHLNYKRLSGLIL